MKASEKTVSQGQVSEDMVREYLIDNGDFLQRNPDLMDHLHIEHASGSAVSLVEKQVSVLRERNIDMRRRLGTLTGNARDNDALFEASRKLVLQLIEANTPAQLSAAFINALKEDFGVDYGCVILFGNPSETVEGVRVESADQAREQIGALMRGGPLCGALREEELNYLFPASGGSGSAAVIPLGQGAKTGLIAVGSADANRYSRDMDTLFLSHIADVIQRLLPRLGYGPS